jgi:murein L,D-transpeptidase YafK
MVLFTRGATALDGAQRGIDVSPREESASEHHNRVQLFARRGLPYPAPVIHLRAFKHEAELELWAGQRRHPLRLIRTYPICAPSGKPGPRRRQGDLQVPEAFERINLLNPKSRFHRSMRVSYPNRSDNLFGQTG